MSHSELPADVTDVATGESVTIQTEHGLYVDPKALSRLVLMSWQNNMVRHAMSTQSRRYWMFIKPIPIALPVSIIRYATR